MVVYPVVDRSGTNLQPTGCDLHTHGDKTVLVSVFELFWFCHVSKSDCIYSSREAYKPQTPAGLNRRNAYTTPLLQANKQLKNIIWF